MPINVSSRFIVDPSSSFSLGLSFTICFLLCSPASFLYVLDSFHSALEKHLPGQPVPLLWFSIVHPQDHLHSHTNHLAGSCAKSPLSIFTVVVKSQHFTKKKATHFRFYRLLDYFSYHFVAPFYLHKLLL